MELDDASSADMRRRFATPAAGPRPLDEDTVERLLAGDLPPHEAPPGYAEVAALLAATVAPPTPEELAGQAAALANLRAVTRPRRAIAGTRRAVRAPRRRRAGLAAVVLVGALVTGGAAAAATGNLPAPLRDAARSILAAADGADSAPSAQPGTQAAPAPTPGSDGGIPGVKGPGATAAADHGPGSTHAGAAPGLDNRGLCRAYLAGNGAEQGEKLDAIAFEALARLAGGREQITSYCEKLVPGWAEPKEDRQQKELPRSTHPGPGGPPVSSGGGQG
jgi:hypothetical protein